MSRSVNKQGSTAKRLHVQLLRIVLWSCLLLVTVTLILQVANLFSPMEKDDSANEVMLADSLPFRFTVFNIFPFLMLPMLVLTVLFLYLKYFLAMNPLTAGSRIRYFSKHGKTVLGRRFCRVFCIAVSAVSLLLAGISYARSGEILVVFGFFNVVSTALLHYYGCKQLRHCRRQYNGWKKQKAVKQD